MAATAAKQVPGIALEVALQSTIGISSEQFAQALIGLVNPETPLAARARQFAVMMSQDKGLLGEALARKEIECLLPGSKVISQPLKVGERGIDLVTKIQINEIDHYIIIEAKTGTSKLNLTKKDGLQMSDTWIRGEGSGFDRLHKAVGRDELKLIKKAEENGRVEKWLIHTDKQQQVGIKLLGPDGKPLPSEQQVSNILEKLL
ncbi:MAG: hypothetical protein AAHH96_00035 [Candidatus Symbiodolus clandestinus]